MRIWTWCWVRHHLALLRWPHLFRWVCHQQEVSIHRLQQRGSTIQWTWFKSLPLAHKWCTSLLYFHRFQAFQMNFHWFPLQFLVGECRFQPRWLSKLTAYLHINYLPVINLGTIFHSISKWSSKHVKHEHTSPGWYWIVQKLGNKMNFWDNATNKQLFATISCNYWHGVSISTTIGLIKWLVTNMTKDMSWKRKRRCNYIKNKNTYAICN